MSSQLQSSSLCPFPEFSQPSCPPLWPHLSFNSKMNLFSGMPLGKKNHSPQAVVQGQPLVSLAHRLVQGKLGRLLARNLQLSAEAPSWASTSQVQGHG